MNKERRKKLSNIALRLQVNLDELNNILDEEQDYYDNIPENLQCSIRADDSEEAIDTLTENIDALSEIIDAINGI